MTDTRSAEKITSLDLDALITSYRCNPSLLFSAEVLRCLNELKDSRGELAQAKADTAQHIEWVGPQLERLGREMQANSQLREGLAQAKSRIKECESLLMMHDRSAAWNDERIKLVERLRGEL